MNILNYIHKSPHRNQLEDYLKVFLPKLLGSTLDIGSKNRRYDYLLKQKPIAVDLLENKEREVLVGDITNLSFTDRSFQSVICLEVLEYVSDSKRAVNEIARVLSSGGEAVISIPFMYRVHQDKIRYTEEGLKELFKEHFSSVEILPIGNFYTVILDIIRGKIILIKSKLLKYLCYLPYVFLLLLLPIFRLSKDRNFASGYVILAKK